MKSELLKELEWRGFIAQITHSQELDDLAADKKITAYIGFDCTAESLHVGSLIQIMILRLLQKHGHRPLVLLGGGTTKIGDPSGKDEARQILTEERIANNLSGIKNTLAKFIEFEDNAGAILVNNNDWLKNLNYIEFLRDIGKYFSINRMLTFDSVKTRLERDQPLSFLEFNYMILQAYDFYVLNRDYGCKLQIGGSDQWGNIVNGVELIRRIDHAEFDKATKTEEAAYTKSSNEHKNYIKKRADLYYKLPQPSFGLTTPLLTTSDGKKMGKTANGALWLDENLVSPFDYFQYFRNTTDEDTIKFIKLFTDLTREEISQLEKLQGQEINKAKEILAFETTKICHGEKSAIDALRKAREIFVKKNENAFEEVKISETIGKKLIHIIKEIGATESASEAKRLIEGKGVKINGEVVLDVNYEIEKNPEGYFNLQVGKKKFFRVCF